MNKSPVIIYPNMAGHRTPIERPDSIIAEWSTAAVSTGEDTSVRALTLRVTRGKDSRLLFLPGDLAKQMAEFIQKEFK